VGNRPGSPRRPATDVEYWQARQDATGVNFQPDRPKLLTPAEIEFLERFKVRGENLEYWIAESLPDQFGCRAPSNDFYWQGHEWELKSTAAEYAVVRKRIKDDLRKSKTRFVIDLGAESMDDMLRGALINYKCKRGLDGLVVMWGGGRQLTEL